MKRVLCLDSTETLVQRRREALQTHFSLDELVRNVSHAEEQLLARLDALVRFDTNDTGRFLLSRGERMLN